MKSIEETLKERGGTYADFRDNAIVAQELKEAMRAASGWSSLPPYMQEGFDMIVSKISRAVTGDPLHLDNLHDIVGYGKLMEDRATTDREYRDAPVSAVTDRESKSVGEAPEEIQHYVGEDTFDPLNPEHQYTALIGITSILQQMGFHPTPSGTMINSDGHPPYRALKLFERKTGQ